MKERKSEVGETEDRRGSRESTRGGISRRYDRKTDLRKGEREREGVGITAPSD